MYYYSSSFEFLGVVILMVAIVVLVAWILAISMSSKPSWY